MSQPQAKLSRRTMFAGAGTAGALAAAATLLPQAAPPTEAASEKKEPPERGGGYQLTEHVKRYYKTTLV
ncbi:MAG: formate dehydrogenase [Pseudomonadota bacterium]